MSAIKERLEKVAKEKENIMALRLQEYLKAQANNLHKLITDLLQDLEKEKNRIKNADMVAIAKQKEAYEKLSDEIEMGFREAYKEFISGFIQNIRDGLNEALKEAIKNADRKIKGEKKIEEKEDHYPTKVRQKGFLGPIKRVFGRLFGEKSWGYDEVWRTEITEVTTVKAGVVVDYLEKMHKICENALNDSVKSFKSVFKKELYAKVFPILRKIINDDSLIDEVAFKRSVHAAMDNIKFEKFDHTDIPSEIKNQTGLLKDYRAYRFSGRVKEHLKDFEDKIEKDMEGYIKVLEENLKDQNFAADVLLKLKNDMQNLRNQIQNKEQSIAQIEGQIKALKEIQ